MTNVPRAFLLTVLTVFATMAIAATAADACPPRTVFSARNGNGLCLVAGQGLTVAARCTVATGGCPARTMRKRSNNDPTRTYCCPIDATNRGTRICVWRGTGPICKGACFRGEVVGGHSTAGCISGHRFKCCNRPL